MPSSTHVTPAVRQALDETGVVPRA